MAVSIGKTLFVWDGGMKNKSFIQNLSNTLL